MPNRRLRLADSTLAPSDDKTQGDVAAWDSTSGLWQLGRRMNYRGVWQAGTYYEGEVVSTVFGVLVANKTTTDTALPSSADWNNLTFYGLGGMDLSTPTAGADIGAGWNDVLLDTTTVDGPGVDMDPATGRWQYTLEGFWDVRVQIFLSHNSSNSGRTTYIRLWDTVSLAPLGNSVPVGVARNAEDTSIIVTVRIPVSDTALLNPILLQIGGGDAITAVTYQSSAVENTWIATYFTGDVTG